MTQASRNAPLVLVIDDEGAIQKLLQVALGAGGFRVVPASSAEEGVVAASMHRPDLVILDLGLPDGDGLSVIARLREWTKVPVLVLSARGREEDKVKALDAGADDYLVKPFGTGELLARIRVALRHAAQEGPAETTQIAAGDLLIDLEKRLVTRSGEEVHLTPIEWPLLSYLARHEGRVLTHRQILKEVWGPNAIGQTQYVRVYLQNLRHKLEVDPSRPAHFLTEAGVGYRFKL